MRHMSDQSQQRKILFIDDDSFLLDMYSLKFSKAGYDVKIANSTELALKLLRDGYEPNVMMIDIVMPGMDGLELVSKIRTEKLVPSSVIIIRRTLVRQHDDHRRGYEFLCSYF